MRIAIAGFLHEPNTGNLRRAMAGERGCPTSALRAFLARRPIALAFPVAVAILPAAVVSPFPHGRAVGMKAWIVASVAALFVAGQVWAGCGPAGCGGSSPFGGGCATGFCTPNMPTTTPPFVPFPPPPPSPFPIEEQLRQAAATLERARAEVANLTAQLAKLKAEQAAQQENAKAECARLAAELTRLKKEHAAQQEKAKAEKLPADNKLDIGLTKCGVAATLGAILKRLDSIEQRLRTVEQKANAPSTPPAVFW
jgi:hypothetical protein